MDKDDWKINFIIFIPSAIIVIFTIFLITIYTKTKELHSYPCYFNILLSSVISIDNVLRLIPTFEDKNTNKDPNDKFFCKFQGFNLALFDKFMLTTMTIYSIISYLGLVKYEFYKNNEKCLFITLIIIGFLISLTFAIIFFINGVTNYEDVCYVKSENDQFGDIKVNKQLIDIIVTSILLLINMYCIGNILYFLYKAIKESQKDNQRKKNYFYHFWKYFFDFILTCSTFLIVILIIADRFIDSAVVSSFIYVILSLLIVLFYTINSRILQVIKRLLCCKREERKLSNIEVEDDEEEEGIEINNIKSEALTGDE